MKKIIVLMTSMIVMSLFATNFSLAQDNGVKVSFQDVWNIAPTYFDEKLIELCKNAVCEVTGEPTMIYSGPLHDAAEMAKVLPSVMMFAKSSKGLSHCKEEKI